MKKQHKNTQPQHENMNKFVPWKQVALLPVAENVFKVWNPEKEQPSRVIETEAKQFSFFIWEHF